jgi:hypothetical protein
MLTVLNSLDEFEELKQIEKGFILYISDGTCNVGVNILPKLEKILSERFPKIKLYYVYSGLTPEIAAQLSVFVIPTVLVYFDGKKFIQKSRSFSLQELQHEIDRYYQLLF